MDINIIYSVDMIHVKNDAMPFHSAIVSHIYLPVVDFCELTNERGLINLLVNCLVPLVHPFPVLCLHFLVFLSFPSAKV